MTQADVRRPSLKHGSRELPGRASRLKLIARVDDPAWYWGHRTMSALSAALCFTVITIGGSMAVVSDVSVLQGIGAFIMVSPEFLQTISCPF